MTHEELLAKIDAELKGRCNSTESCCFECSVFHALRAVVELHKQLFVIAYDVNGNERLCDWTKCSACPATIYPCKTIQAIEKELK